MPPRKACDVCSKRKIRCLLPSSGPPCDWCKAQGLECQFLRESQSSNRLTPAAVQNLLRRVEQLENELATANAQTPSHSSVRSGGLTPCSTGDNNSTQPYSSPAYHSHATQAGPCASPFVGPGIASLGHAPVVESKHRARPWPGHNWFFRGIQILSEAGENWLASKIGKEFAFQNFSLFRPKPCMQEPATSEHEILQLPAEATTRELATLYFQSTSYQICPVLDPLLFEETVRTAYKSQSDATLSRSATACIWALCALVSQFNPRTSFGYADSQKYTRNSLSNLDFLSSDWDIDDLQALLLLHNAEPKGIKHTSQRLLQLACQTVVDLDGHVYQHNALGDSGSQCNQHHNRHLRVLFWLCYRLDKDIAFRDGSPPILTQEYSDLTIQKCHDEGTSTTGDNCPSSADLHLAAASQLSIVKEEACRLLFSQKADRDNDNETLLNIRYLDVELENWRASLPSSFQPKLSTYSNHLFSAPDRSSSGMIRSLFLQLDYHHTLIVIHSTIRRCRNTVVETGSMPEDLHQVVHSSINLSLEAARSTLYIMKNAITQGSEDALHHITTYIPVAVMALFMNVIIHPFDPRAQPDLAILTNTVSTIQGIDLVGVTDDKAEELQALCEFLMGLVSSGNGAIWKAKRDLSRKSNGSR